VTALPEGIAGLPGEACKIITAIVNDDGSDLKILEALRSELGIVRANSSSCFSSSSLSEAKTKPGKLPEPILARIVEVIVPAKQADEVFDFVCRNTKMDHIGAAMVYQSTAPFCTPYELPEGVPDETA
jgi:hypothetical protein